MEEEMEQQAMGHYEVAFKAVKQVYTVCIWFHPACEPGSGSAWTDSALDAFLPYLESLW